MYIPNIARKNLFQFFEDVANGDVAATGLQSPYTLNPEAYNAMLAAVEASERQPEKQPVTVKVAFDFTADNSVSYGAWKADVGDRQAKLPNVSLRGNVAGHDTLLSANFAVLYAYLCLNVRSFTVSRVAKSKTKKDETTNEEITVLEPVKYNSGILKDKQRLELSYNVTRPDAETLRKWCLDMQVALQALTGKTDDDDNDVVNVADDKTEPAKR